uniref:ToxA n=1 Tax=Dichelobacter nodosus TaxID=870 RepID=Q5I710_DICNO|nr:ToxA [Dichelobacter nodosus]
MIFDLRYATRYNGIFPYHIPMIKSFAHKGLKRFFEEDDIRGIQPHHATKLRILLYAIDLAENIKELDIEGAELHQLKGKLKTHWSLKVNGNWRVIFEFKNGNAYIVDYVDYH